MFIWIIILFCVISNAFFLGFQYARRIENKLDMPVSGKRHLYCLGDGITYGVGVLNNRKAFAWPYQLEVNLGAAWQVINYGTEDATLLESRTELKAGRAFHAFSQAEKPLVLLMIGTNDSKLGIWSERRFEPEFSAFLDQMRAKCAGIIVLLPIAVHPPRISVKSDIRAEIVEQIAQMESDICQRKQVHFIDLFSLTGKHPEWYANDGIHLNQQGNREVADAVYLQIRKVFLPPQSPAAKTEAD